MSMPSPPVAPSSPPRAGAGQWAALILAVAGAVGSLFLSLGMGLKACPLCFYQRAFMMGAAAVLAMGLVARAGRPGLLALPLAVGGLGIAAYHVSLELRGKLECPSGLLGLGSAPQQSLGVFLALAGILTADAAPATPSRAGRWPSLAAALALGALLAVGSTVANPPPPAAPLQAHGGPPEVCRPPYQPGP